MNAPKMNLDARLGLDKYVIDENNSHIEIDQSRCEICEKQPCLTVCPAEVYRLVDDQVTARYENCIECGTCQIACDDIGEGGITWHPPVGGFGIVYRYG
jgi:ferredoxin like protein